MGHQEIWQNGQDKEKINKANSATVLNQPQLGKGNSGSGRLTMTQGPLTPKAHNSREEND